jgi:hypothetical protein
MWIQLSKRRPTGLASLVAALACSVLLVGCLGAGDDTSVPIPTGDAQARDATPSGDGTTGAAEGGDATSGPDATFPDAADGGAVSPPAASFSTSMVNFGSVGCGSMPAAMPIVVSNGGGSPLHVSATEVGAGFSISPNALTVAPGASGTINVSVSVPTTASPGTPITGSIAMFTDDALNSNVVVLLSATPNGAWLTGAATYGFASTEVGSPAPPQSVVITNSGNAPASFTIGAPSDPSVTLNGFGGAGTMSLAPGATFSGTASFVPTGAGAVTATASVTVAGTTCGQGLTSLTFNGKGASGALAGWPSGDTIDFGLVSCAGAAPAPQRITLTNSSLTTDVRITAVDTSGIGSFTTDAMPGEVVPAGGSLDIHFGAPAGPLTSPTLAKVTGTVVFSTDASITGTALTLTEEPQGAILAFGTATTSGCTTSASLGSFGSAGVLLQPGPSQNFCVVNTGNAPAGVALIAAEEVGATADAGADSGADASVDAGIASPYALLAPSFTLPAGTSSMPSVEQESIAFQPLHSGPTVGSLEISTGGLVASLDGSMVSTVLCAPLPDPIALSGSAVGGGPLVTPTALSFPATCGGAAPQSQTFVVSNMSPNVDLSWSLAGPTGTGAGQYTVTASPTPGTLAPGASSTVTVTALAVPSPAVNADPASLAAQVVITTDVPFDPPHVVTLTEVPLGDQLFVTLPDQGGGTLRFGQVPLSTPVIRTLTLTNNANPGSPAANVALSVGGTGGAAYSLGSSSSAPASSASSGVAVTFNPASAGPYVASLNIATSDALCTPLPSPVVLQGTGTAGAESLSATTLYFGTDPTATNPSERGLVACGSTGSAQTLILSNTGTQAFTVKGISLGKGMSSPFTLSGPATMQPSVAINATTTVTITPAAIPSSVANPNDATAFSDILTVTTDIPGDTGQAVTLVMQPLGAVITGSQPPTAWTFGTVAEGSIGTFQGTMVQNAGNAPAMVALQPATALSLPSVFSLQGSPVTVPANGVTSLVGEFTPNLPNSTWNGQGELVVTAATLCAPLPTAWMSPQINLSGASTSNPIVTVSGSLVFPTTDCGGAPASGQSVTLANQTNQVLTYTPKFVLGAHYTLADGGSGMLPANGTATIVVNPIAVNPGAGVLPGSAPYADELLIGLATMPATTLTVPVSWTLNGAVLSLPDGAGPFGTPPSQFFYAADSASGFPFPISNTGTAAATVDLAIQPVGAFSLLPAPPVQVLAGIPARPELVSAPTAPTCPATPAATATFTYSGPVCQPLPFTSVSVDACSGTYVGTFQCFAPTPNLCGASTCVSFATDPANCGSCGNACGTGQTCSANACVTSCAGGQTFCGSACTNTASDVNNCGGCGNVCSGATPLCQSNNCVAPPLTICTSGTCNAATQVTCPNQTGGVCTQTEAAFIQLDLSANPPVITGPGPAYTGNPSKSGPSCLSCLVASSCVDNPAHNIKKRECDDFTAAFTAGNGHVSTQNAACLATLSCMIGSTGMQCAANAAGDSYCYCGAGGFAGVGPSSCTGTNDTAVNGSCLVPEANGFTFGQTDALDIGDNYTDTSGANPSGVANQILTCAQGNSCNSCLQ